MSAARRTAQRRDRRDLLRPHHTLVGEDTKQLPFIGMELQGKASFTLVDGQLVYGVL